MRILVITNTTNQTFNPSLLNLFGAIKKIITKCDVLILGQNLQEVAKQVSQYNIVEQVLIPKTDLSADNLLAENIAPILADMSKEYTHVLISADSFGKNLLPRVAGILGIGQISEITDVITPNIFRKFIYAGNVLIETESLEDLKLLTVRTASFPIDFTTKPDMAPITIIDYTINNSNDKIKILSQNYDNNTIDLNKAKVVVTGGASLGSEAAFNEYIRGLAIKLHAGVGASRSAVEAGFATNDCQIGQTGKIVAPELYLAIGVSGAVQHIAGMKDSQTVIAINLDEKAPIFEHADYGLVADLFDVIPQIINKI